MNLKTLDQAAKLLVEIKALDEQILGLEKWAESLVSGHYEIEVKFKFKNLDNKDKAKFDEDGSLIKDSSHQSPYGFSFFMDIGRIRSNDDDKGTEKFEVKTNEVETLYMIGALLSMKNDKRNELITSIKKLGYE